MTVGLEAEFSIAVGAQAKLRHNLDTKLWCSHQITAHAVMVKI